MITKAGTPSPNASKRRDGYTTWWLYDLGRHTLPAFKRQVFDLMSLKIQETQHLSVMLRYCSAEQRIIALLLSFSRRFHRRHLSPTRFTLPISRSEMANYLGLAVETVSRLLHHLHEAKLITVDGREVSLHNVDVLKERLRASNRRPP